MLLPSKDADAMELVNFINSYNRDIHTAMLEGDDYRGLIDDLIRVDLYKRYPKFCDAMKAIHTTKRRYYVGTRDITDEVNHVLDNMTAYTDSDLQHTIEDADLLIEGNQEAVIYYLDGEDLGEDIEAVKYLKSLEKVLDFSYDETNSKSRNIWEFTTWIERLETRYRDTIECTYLPLLALTAEEKKTIKKSEDTTEVEALILKIFQKWNLVNKGASKYARNATATGGDEGVGSYTINRHLESMGVYRKQYYNFISKKELVASKKLVLAMGLYFVPNEIDSMEKFMNAFGYSLKSNIATTIESDTGEYMLDSEIRKLLRSGLDTELIVMLIAEKSNEVKKSAASNFS